MSAADVCQRLCLCLFAAMGATCALGLVTTEYDRLNARLMKLFAWEASALIAVGLPWFVWAAWTHQV